MIQYILELVDCMFVILIYCSVLMLSVKYIFQVSFLVGFTY